MSTGTSTFVIRWVNFLTMLVAAAVIGYGVWMSSHHDGCRKSLTLPVMGLGSVIFLMFMVTNNGSGHTVAGLRAGVAEYIKTEWRVVAIFNVILFVILVSHSKLPKRRLTFNCINFVLNLRDFGAFCNHFGFVSICSLPSCLMPVDDLFRGVLCKTKRCQNALEILKDRYNNLLSSKATTPEGIESLDLEEKCKLRLEGPRLIETDERRILTRELETNL
ncbi:hypothetical protein L6452_06654 [Arctium lappa]|uniref:Uncharacterized protein n=1 Tax=Arctium lappa TaxID=4217 RepID=A0ACB9EK70_ARCLA|nr:hypothetical protein L6452_06654 [Arctium lappa]